MSLKFLARGGGLAACALALVLAAGGCASGSGTTGSPTTTGASGATGSGPARARAPAAVIGKVWQWESMVTPNETIDVATPERYTLQLLPDGKLVAQLDCNRGTGGYLIDDGTISVSGIASTRAACPPGSLDTRFARALSRAKSFQVEDGKLTLELLRDEGTMRFRAAN